MGGGITLMAGQMVFLMREGVTLEISLVEGVVCCRLYQIQSSSDLEAQTLDSSQTL